ncbi:alpha/beta hydrolase [Virgibacillus doumboii]|uniref:alpha/beta hydrolase n=1 Tax=Virgibacillus doumboii TaxID=2697503 RepID=UPI0013DF3C59|nr:alpha/beta hydrolase-fold protein [Virgibacillus doumboii]
MIVINERDMDILNITSDSIHSEFFHKRYEYDVLRSGETIEDAYVLYVQDGKDYMELGRLRETFQQLLEHYPRLAKKLVFVLIHPGDSMERWHSYHHKGEQFEKFIDFMVDELIPTVEKRLTSLNINIAKRGMLGDSLAGNVSVNIAAKNPEKWTHLLLQSAAVQKEDIRVLSNVEKLSWNIYQTVGIYENQFVSTITKEKLYILTRNRELYKAFAEKGAAIDYTEQEESHEWVFWERDLWNPLSFFITTPDHDSDIID